MNFLLSLLLSTQLYAVVGMDYNIEWNDEELAIGEVYYVFYYKEQIPNSKTTKYSAIDNYGYHCIIYSTDLDDTTRVLNIYYKNKTINYLLTKL